MPSESAAIAMTPRHGFRGASRRRLVLAGLTGAALSSVTANGWGASVPLQVLACEPEWAALVQELAGERAEVYLATTAQQDPHRIQARPSLLAAARRADLLVCTGAELEAGWLPVLQRQSGNPAIQPGQPGSFLAAEQVSLLERPARLDRSDGDVHAAGNPHIQTEPHNLARVAAALVQRLAQVDAAHAAHYQRRGADFDARWRTAIQTWEERARPLRGVPIVVQHRGFPYLERWLGLQQVAALEPKPGVEPSSGHLAAVLEQLRRQPARMILRAAYNDPRSADWLAERTGLPVVVLPYTVGGSPAAGNLFGLFDDTLARLLQAAGTGPGR